MVLIVHGSYVSVLWNKPVDSDKKVDLLSLRLQRIWESASQHGRSSLGWRTDLLPAHHSQASQVKVAPAFADRAWQHLYRHLDNEAWLQSQDFTQDWANFLIWNLWKRCIVVSLVLQLKTVHNTIVTCKLNFPSLVMHHFDDLFVHQHEAVG